MLSHLIWFSIEPFTLLVDSRPFGNTDGGNRGVTALESGNRAKSLFCESSFASPHDVGNLGLRKWRKRQVVKRLSLTI